MTMVLRLPAVSFAAIALFAACEGHLGGEFLLSNARADPESRKLQSDMQKLHLDIKKRIDRLRGTTMPEGIVKTNGRIEATQVDVSAKYAGRLASVSVKEGDEVTAGQVIARISSPEYEAQLRGARAQVLKAKQALAEADALIAQRRSDLAYAKHDVERGQPLVEKGYQSKKEFELRVTKAEVADSALRAAEARREEAQSGIKSAEAEVERIDAILVDLTLLAPRSGRVQYQLRWAGEVVNAGTRIVTVLDLNDVYMTIYLPATQAGQLSLGDEARMILDPLPKTVIPATVSFVATDAQFTPKSVETTDEREKLMFRVKLQVDPTVLKKYYKRVKTGVRGMGFVRTDSAISWPEEFATKLVQ